MSAAALDVMHENFTREDNNTLYPVLGCAKKKFHRKTTGRMKTWCNSFLAILLAVTMMSALVAPHGANADSQKAGTDERSGFQIASVLTTNHHGGDAGVMNECFAMLGHCATVECSPQSLGHPIAVKVDTHRISFKAQFYSAFSSIDVPPPRA